MSSVFFCSLLFANKTALLRANQFFAEEDNAFFSACPVKDTAVSGSIDVKEFFEPALMMTYGVIRINTNLMHGFDRVLKSNLQKNVGPKRKIDDIAQYLPTAAFLGLDWMGIKAKNNFENRLIYGAAAHLLMGVTVNMMKNSVIVHRPDRSASNSFPSGHTATAFVGAELVWQEYKDQSIWYGVSAYALAAGTGFFRMYNNRHWFSDVVMGAGIGIASVKLTYLLFPLIQHKISRRKQNLSFIPVYNGVHTGLSMRLMVP